MEDIVNLPLVRQLELIRHRANDLCDFEGSIVPGCKLCGWMISFQVLTTKPNLVSFFILCIPFFWLYCFLEAISIGSSLLYLSESFLDGWDIRL